MFIPRYLKEAKQLAKHARKLLRYKRDRLGGTPVSEIETRIDALDKAILRRDRKAIDETATDLDKTCAKYMAPPRNAAWRENCEVLLVALVIYRVLVMFTGTRAVQRAGGLSALVVTS